MTILPKKEDNLCTLAVEGDIDTLTAPELEKAVQEQAPLCEKLTLDFAKVNYISSAGIRAVLRARQIMGNDNLTLKSLNGNVMEIFRMTGFVNMLHSE